MASQKFACALVIALVLVVFNQVNGDLLPGFERCDNTTNKIDNFHVSACPHGAADSSCKIARGAKLVFLLDFTSSRDFRSAKTHINMTGWDFLTNDACQMGFTCPVRAGQKQSMFQKVRVHDLEPSKADIMNFYLLDDKTHEQLACIKFPFELV